MHEQLYMGFLLSLKICAAVFDTLLLLPSFSFRPRRSCSSSDNARKTHFQMAGLGRHADVR